MLIDEGLLTEVQLEHALTAHPRTGLKLGQYLVRQGIVTEPQVRDAVCRQLKLPQYNPKDYPDEINLGHLIPSDVAQKYQLVPLKKKGRLLTVGMTDPRDIEALDTAEVMTDTEVEPVICTEKEFADLMSRIYGKYSSLGGIMESMDEDVQYDTEVEAEAAPALEEDMEVSSLQDMAEQEPVVRLVNSIISNGVQQGASDIHISPEKDYVRVQFRIDGKLHDVPAPAKSMILPIVSRIKILSNMDVAKSRVPQDGRFTVKMERKEINVRTSVMPTIYGENLVMRLLDMSTGVYTLRRLGMCEEDRKKIDGVINKPYGMILSTGPTGSGKSTSLYAILKKLNKPDVNIITIEDPVEYRMEWVRQVQLNVKAGMTFASSLRSILRQDPDIIMVGEIRDAETAGIAIRAALTGHRVLSTIHTNDATSAITRLLVLDIEPFLVSSCVLVSFAQRLVRTICPHCKEPYNPPEGLLANWNMEGLENADFQRGKGCVSCMNTGYKGRTGLYEVLVVDEMIQEMIMEKKSAQEISIAAQKAGAFRRLREDAANKILQGITTFEEAASAVMF
ncbi:MAG: GspE/PulE family protein [Proteobacteria bacterium]|nr:GspE/PulE family protein [Pseudomonadota bacterium]